MTRSHHPTPAPGLMAPVDDRWRDEAACLTADPDMFFPEPGDHATAAKAIAVCQSCPVTDACLRDALATGERHGIRGGLNPQRRARLRTDRRRGIHRTACDSTPRRPRPVEAGEHGIALT